MLMHFQRLAIAALVTLILATASNQANAAAGLKCEFPRTAEGRVQRSGYPDLRIVDIETGRAYYLDPKLYSSGSRDSSFRTFYFEPKIATNKVLEDAVHFLVGFEHEPKSAGRWKIVLVHGFTDGTDGAYQPVSITEFSAGVTHAKSFGDVGDTVRGALPPVQPPSSTAP